MPFRRWLLLSLAVALLALPAATNAVQSKMPPGSFLKEPVVGAQDLARVIKQDPVVAKRYSRHFAMSPAALADYFSHNARVKSLTHSHKYTVYYVGKSGSVVSRVKTIKAGSRVIIAWTSEPIMELRCGNPFLKRLPQPPVKVAAFKAETPPPVVTQPPAPAPVETKVLDVPPVELPTVEPAVVVPIQPAVVGTVSSSPSWLLPGLIGAGAIGALSGGGGGVVPEPAGLLALGIGALGIICSRRALRRK